MQFRVTLFGDQDDYHPLASGNAHTYVCMYVCMCACVCVCMYVYMYACMYMYICTYVGM